ncbi:hypothetical protein BLX87_06210 [Bacillus sp. VT-16-64]|nr:hypothetical protein BLX87_06210 [Bacillus sp. VT-16-64]
MLRPLPSQALFALSLFRVALFLSVFLVRAFSVLLQLLFSLFLSRPFWLKAKKLFIASGILLLSTGIIASFDNDSEITSVALIKFHFLFFA